MNNTLALIDDVPFGVAAPGPVPNPDSDEQRSAHAALKTLVSIVRWENGRAGWIGRACREAGAEMAAVHPEWNRAGRRAFARSLRRKGHK